MMLDDAQVVGGRPRSLARPGARATRSAAARDGSVTGWLSERRRRTLAALVDTIVPGSSATQAVEPLLASRGALFRHAVALALDALELAALATPARAPFSRCDRESRTALLERSVASPLRAVRAGLRFACSTTYLVHYAGNEDAGPKNRLRVEGPAPQAPPERARSEPQAGAPTAQEHERCQVVIVGTGAGGAPLASELAEEGLDVLLLEEGVSPSREHYHGPLHDRIARGFRNGGGFPTMGTPAMPVLVGWGVGGSTTVSNGTCFRAPPEVLRRWRTLDGIALGEMDDHYRHVERALGVGPVPEPLMGTSSRLLAEACRRLGWEGRAVDRYAPACQGSGTCCFGCPTGAKSSAELSFVPWALRRGARLKTGARVDRVRIEGGRATGVEATVRGADGQQRRLFVRADVIVLAGGALFTPLLLARSGVKGHHVGRNLHLQPCVKLMASMPEPVDPERGVPQAYGTEAFRDRGILLLGIQVPAAVGASSMPGFGAAHARRMEGYASVASLVAVVRDEASGRVLAGPGGAPVVRYDLGAAELGRVRFALERMGEALLEVGARELILPTFAPRTVTREQGVNHLRASARAIPAADLSLVSYHPMGSCRMATDPRAGVVDPLHQVHGVGRLLVCDASVLPSALGVNPQLTIMALAVRLARHLRDRRAPYFG
jgi:choline dehydrogenase-like flavoprotein